VKRKRVTEIVVETVARRTVADVAVGQDTVGLVVTEVSQNSFPGKNDETNCS